MADNRDTLAERHNARVEALAKALCTADDSPPADWDHYHQLAENFLSSSWLAEHDRGRDKQIEKKLRKVARDAHEQMAAGHSTAGWRDCPVCGQWLGAVLGGEGQ